MGWKRDLLDWIVAGYSALNRASAVQPANPSGIFVLRNNDLGDVLAVTPLFQALRQRFPKTRIAAGVGSWATPILERNPNVDDVIPINAPWHNGQVRQQGLGATFRYLAGSSEIDRLKRERFEVGIDVLGSAFGSCLLTRAGIPWRLGVRGYAGGHTACQQWIDFNEHDHVGRSALRFAELLGADRLPEVRPQIFLDSPPVPAKTIVLAPGGGYRGKCWQVAQFTELARRLAPASVTVIGGPQDRDAGVQIGEAGDHVKNVAGAASLRETFGIIGAARVVVCNSSMAMHAAAAFRVPSVVVLGPALAGNPTQHTAQWAYPESRVLGGPPTVEQAWAAVQECLALL